MKTINCMLLSLLMMLSTVAFADVQAPVSQENQVKTEAVQIRLTHPDGTVYEGSLQMSKEHAEKFHQAKGVQADACYGICW